VYEYRFHIFKPGNYIGSFERNVLPLVDEDKARESLERSSDEIEEEKPTEEEYEEFAKKILKHHNEYRKKHNSQELK
jgi:hypothetical protein